MALNKPLDSLKRGYMEIQKDSLITKVGRFARSAHSGQVRKYTGDPIYQSSIKSSLFGLERNF